MFLKNQAENKAVILIPDLILFLKKLHIGSKQLVNTFLIYKDLYQEQLKM